MVHFKEHVNFIKIYILLIIFDKVIVDQGNRLISRKEQQEPFSMAVLETWNSCTSVLLNTRALEEQE